MIDVIHSSLGPSHIPISDSNDLKFFSFFLTPSSTPANVSSCSIFHICLSRLLCNFFFPFFLPLPYCTLFFFFFKLHLVKAMVFLEVMYECDS